MPTALAPRWRVYGARELRRYIQREVETIGRALIAGQISDGATITVDVAGDRLNVRWDAAAVEEEPVEFAGAA